MKKITATLGASYSEFDHQIKDILNDISDSIDQLLTTENKENKIAKQCAKEGLHSPICDSCRHRASFIITNIVKDTHQYFCDDCLKQ